jgi:hypothetical protein
LALARHPCRRFRGVVAQALAAPVQALPKPAGPTPAGPAQSPVASPPGGSVPQRRKRRRKLHSSANPAELAWRAARRELACFRYQDGMLEPCPNRGDQFWDLACDVRAAAEEDAFVPPLPRRPRNLGVYGVDLRREERRSGVPAWFMPDSSRRRRAHCWTHESPWRWVQYVAHILDIYYWTGAKLRRLQLALYLVAGEPWEPHAEAVRDLLGITE